MKLLDKLLGDENGKEEDGYYDGKVEEVAKDAASKGGQMILIEPRAYSEAESIATSLKQRNSVVVNLKRVTSDQAKRIIDFLSGCIFAIGGSMKKIGVGIYLCTPKNVTVQGAITEDSDKKVSKKHKTRKVIIYSLVITLLIGVLSFIVLDILLSDKNRNTNKDKGLTNEEIINKEYVNGLSTMNEYFSFSLKEDDINQMLTNSTKSTGVPKYFL